MGILLKPTRRRGNSLDPQSLKYYRSKYKRIIAERQVVRFLAEVCMIRTDLAELILDGVGQIIRRELERGNRVDVPHVGTFYNRITSDGVPLDSPKPSNGALNYSVAYTPTKEIINAIRGAEKHYKEDTNTNIKAKK